MALPLESAQMVDAVSFIIDKRDGRRHTADDVRAFVRGFLAGEVTDYQMTAWLMAAFLTGLDDRETLALTDAMLHSGKVLRMRRVPAFKVDKHSTGGVGDKISLCLAPAVAAVGLAVPMISGRGLGHTGGTLDKLESIPGFDTRLDEKTFERVVAKVGCAIVGQTERVAPADRRIYALRDVTGTVESIPLIVASILSKKLAAGLDGLVLDVKAGGGAFMETVDDARRLARALVRVGRRSDTKVRALLTDMNAPIGWAIGNALEVREAVEVLEGRGPKDTVELTVELGAEMCMVGGAFRSRAEARARIGRVLADGTARERFVQMVEAQGGDPRVIDDLDRLPRASHRVVVAATQAGRVKRVDARALGLVAVGLGAGRSRADQDVDPAVGLEVAVTPGDAIAVGEPLAWLHVRRPADARRVADRVRQAFVVGTKGLPVTTRIVDRLT